MGVMGFTRADLSEAAQPSPTAVPKRTNPSDPKPTRSPYKNPSDPKPSPSPYKNPSDPKPSPSENPSDPKPSPSN
jgi:hypothetical protein